jgi:nucleoid DNA-binding protein
MIHVSYVDSGYSGTGTYRPVIRPEATSSWERIRSLMVRDTSLAEADVDRVMARFADTIGEELLAGREASTPLGRFGLSCKKSGILRGMSSNRMRVRGEDLAVTFRAARSLRESLRRHAEIRYLEPSRASEPVVSHVRLADGEEAHETTILWPQPTTVEVDAGNRVLQLTGSRLSLDARDPEQGVFLAALEAGSVWTPGSEGSTPHRSPGVSETRIGSYLRTGSRYLDVLLPRELSAGRYGVRLVTRPPRCWLRVVRLPLVLEVTGGR